MCLLSIYFDYRASQCTLHYLIVLLSEYMHGVD